MNDIKKSVKGIFSKKNKLNKVLELFSKRLGDELLDDFLEMLLFLMSLVIILDNNYRNNIKNFKGRYCFKSRDGGIKTSFIFKKNKMKVSDKEIRNTDVEVVFNDGKTLKEFLFSPNPDILSFMLDNKISYKGNLNYILKFGYMSNHLKYMFNLG